MPLALDEFRKRVVDSGLLSADELAAFVAGLPEPPADTQQLAKSLVRARQLTAYQAQTIYAGQGRNLVLGNYVVLDKLGQGGMGLVLKAHHRRMQRLVALKVLSPAVTKDKAALLRFQREAVAAARLMHPHIVAAHDADEAKGTHFLVMEYVDGRDLAALVKERGPLSVPQAVRCTIEAARGLAYAHAHGVIHRDVKPSNLLLDAEGTVKVLDMGLARLEGNVGPQTDLTASGAVMGTVDFMSPEQAEDTKHADARSDIYSLGISLWFLLTGRHVYERDSMVSKLVALREAPLPSLCAARSDVPAALEAVFRKMAAKDPAQRYQTMAQAITALEACQPSGSSPPRLEGGLAADEDDKLAEFLRGQSAGRGTAPSPTAATAHRARAALDDATVAVSAGADNTQMKAATAALPASSRRMSSANLRVPLILGGILVAGMAALLLFLSFILSRGGGGKPKPADAPTAKAAKEGVKPASGTGKTVPAVDPNRRAAEWVLSVGGRVVINHNGEQVPLSGRATRLPPVQFEVTHIRFDDKDKVTDEGLENLRGLSGLKELELQQTKVTSRAAPLLKGLSSLKNLDLSFTPFDDRGAMQLAALENLTNLNLGGTETGTPGLEAMAGHLPHLEALTIWPGVTDEGLRHLSAFPSLIFVGLKAHVINDRGVKHLAAATGLVKILVVGLSDAELQSLSSLDQTEELWLDFNALTPAGLTSFGKWFPKLRELKMTNRESISDEFVAHIGHVDELRMLSFRNTGITDGCLADLEERRSLDGLDLRETKISAEGIGKLHSALPACRIWSDRGNFEPDETVVNRRAAEWILSIGGEVKIESPQGGTSRPKGAAELPDKTFWVTEAILIQNPRVTNSGLCNLKGLSKLEHLNLIVCDKLTPSAAETIAELTSLRRLALDFTSIDDRGLARLARLTNLVELYVAETPTGNEGLAQIAGRLDHLEILLIGRDVTDEGLSHLAKFKALRTVYGLRSHTLSDLGVAHLKKLPGLKEINLIDAFDSDLPRAVQLKQLEVLGLNFAHVTPGGLKALAALPNLKVLNFDNSGAVTDAHLKEAAKLPLTGLFLKGTTITDDAATHLAGMASLRVLHITQTKLTPAGVQKLRDALPQCRIESDHGVFEPK